MSLINKKAIKEYVNTQLDRKLSESIYDTIEDKLKILLNDASTRAAANSRKVVRASDL